MNNEVLVESQTARNEQIQRISNEDCIVKLNYVKKIDFNNFNENQVITTQDVSEFYKVVPETIRTLIKTNREELETDGLKTLSGQELQDARQVITAHPKSSQLTIWTPRAVLRTGMLLQDSEVAHKLQRENSDIFMEKKRLEIKFGDYLEAVIGWKYKILRQFPVKLSSGINYLDFYVRDLRLAIEYDEHPHNYHKEEDKKREEKIKKVIPNLEFVRIEQGKEHKGINIISKKAFN